MTKPSTDKVYFAKYNVKMTVTLNNRNIQIGIIELNRKSIITLLNKLPYLSDSMHPKTKYVDLAIKLLKIEYRS